MDTYAIETDSDGGFRVRVTGVDGKARVVEDFPSEREARAWVNDQIQIALRSANASDVA
jgi:hypothetical protein